MVAHIEKELVALAARCECQSRGKSSGWTIDAWEPSPEALEALTAAYEKLISPMQDTMENLLVSDGVDLGAVFHPEGQRVDDTTRADAVELLAAGAAIATEHVSPTLIHLPNIPKASRRYSSRGIDIMAADVDATFNGAELGDSERLIVYSVKHSVSDVRDLVRKLTRSVSADSLTQPYVFEQVRVLHGRLQERGVTADRLFRVVGNFHESEHVLIVAVGGASSASRKDYEAALQLLPMEAAGRHFRQLLVADLELLHERLN